MMISGRVLIRSSEALLHPLHHVLHFFTMSSSSFFSGKVVLITGSSNGIGREVARRFAALGAKITITGRKADALSATRKVCIGAGANEGNILEVVGDIAHEDTLTKLVEGTVAKFGQIDVLINNAGLFAVDPMMRTGIEQPLEIFDTTMAVDLRSIVALSQLAIPHLEKSKGAIVNVSSILAAPVVSPSSPYYAVAKAALDQLTIQMAGTLIHKGIRVNCVNPGTTVTNIMVNAGIPQETSDQIYKGIASNGDIPIGRVGTSEDIAELILFLADRSKSEFIVGQRITIDGGSSLRNVLLSKDTPVLPK